jgi:hypothetical protein
MEDNFKPLIEKIRNLKSDVLIFFTPGGWGDISPEGETYAKTLLEGVQKTLKSWQYKIVLINYPRAKSGILGKVKSLKESLLFFPSESRKLADLIKNITNNFKNIKIILIGYSFGGAFLNEVMKKITENKQTYCIQAGTPFFCKKLLLKNILYLDNNGEDPLANGNIKKLSFIGIIGILKLILLFKLIRLKITECFHLKGHEYFWENSEIKFKVQNFLKNNFGEPYA